MSSTVLPTLPILIMGPTASGKTDLAIEIAKKQPVEIISVDSALVYKDMNIGTAKPDKQTLKDFPHHLVDIISPEQEYNANSFVRDSKKLIKNAIENGKTPVLVGGTAFYFNALQHGLSNLPESTKESRKYFDEILKAKGCVYLHQELQKIDKIASARIHENDSQRITRALEVHYLTGKTLTELQGNKQTKEQKFKKIVIMPPRNILHQRIEKRFLQMIDKGFLSEVEELRDKYNLNENTASMRSVGYRQAWQYLDGKIDKDTMIEKAIIATRQLCKRQSTWFNKEKNALFIDNNDIKKVENYD
jgi:tRNA dimethylallyltransferase